MKLSVIIPVYNEEKTIGKILDKVRQSPLGKEIIVVDDGSTDRTAEILAGQNPRDFTLLQHPSNLGKGTAIRTALKEVTGEIIVIQDADLEYDPKDFENLIQPIQEEISSVVYGSRLLGNPEFYTMGVLRFHREGYFRNPLLTFGFYYGGKLVTWLTNILYGARLTDQPTCYKMFRREVLKEIQLNSRGFEFCSEITAKLLLAGYSIVEVPISYCPRRVSEGKKLNWKDGMRAVFTLFRVRFLSSNHNE